MKTASFRVWADRAYKGVRHLSISVLLFALTAATGDPKLDELALYQDWIVGCDNLRSCHATSLPVEEEGNIGPVGDGNMTVAIKRGAAPSDGPQVQLAVVDSLPDSNMTDIRGVAVDGGKSLLKLNGTNGVFNLDAKASAKLVAAVRHARAIAFVDHKGKVVASASLSGLMAALAYIDERQYRLDTVSALANPGKKVADYRTIPPIFPQSPINIREIPDRLPAGLDEAQISSLRQQDPCLANNPNAAPAAPEYHRMDDKTSLLILPTSCDGYNPYSQIYTISDDGVIAKAQFSRHPGGATLDDTDLVNIWWDKEERRLNSFGRGRVISDCGVSEEFAWSEGLFHLTHYASMSPCRGSRDFITTYRRETVSRPVRNKTE